MGRGTGCRRGSFSCVRTRHCPRSPGGAFPPRPETGMWLHKARKAPFGSPGWGASVRAAQRGGGAPSSVWGEEGQRVCMETPTRWGDASEGQFPPPRPPRSFCKREILLRFLFCLFKNDLLCPAFPFVLSIAAI